MSAQAALVELLNDNPVGDAATDPCGENTDYFWETNAQASWRD